MMKRSVFLAGTGVLTLMLSVASMGMSEKPACKSSNQPMTLKSQQVTNGQSFRRQQLFNSWGCTGKNISPQLQWSNVPPGTKSFAVTQYDPDAPTGSGWWHWVVINIPGNVQQLPLNSGADGGQNLPAGASMIRNDFGYKGYGGACPPPNSQPHDYHITVYALDVPNLDIGPDSSAAMAGFFIMQHTLGKAVITAPTNAR